MSFDPVTLKDRAHQLQDAYQTVLNTQRRPPGGPFQSWGPARQAPDVTDVYDDFLSLPDPAAFTPLTDGLKRAMDQLAPSGFVDDPERSGPVGSDFASGDLAAIGTAGDYFKDWTGDAAAQFKTHYSDKFSAVASNQFALASMLRYAINAEAAIWQAVRDDLDKLSAGAIDKMKHVNDCNAAAFAAALGILAAVVTAPVTGAGSLEVGLGVVAAGAGVAGSGVTAATSASPASDSKDDGVTGNSPTEVMDSLRQRLDEIKAQVRTAEQRIRDTLAGNEIEVLARWDVLLLPAPDIAAATPENITSNAYGGHAA